MAGPVLGWRGAGARLASLALGVLSLAPQLLPHATAQGQGPGSCLHADTTATVREVLVENMGGGQLMRDPASIRAAESAIQDGTVKLSLSAVRTTSIDRTVGRSECEAKLTMALPLAAIQMLVLDPVVVALLGPQGWKRVEGQEAIATLISYSSQRTDDGKLVHVAVAGGKGLGQSIGLSAVAASVARDRIAQGLPGLPGADNASAQRAEPEAHRAPSGTGVCAGLDLSVGVGLTECQNREYAAADAALNASYKAAMARLAPERRTALRTAQRAWLATRTSGCQEEAEKEEVGGTQALLWITGCETKKTRVRTQEIEVFR